jgi:cysteine sulfinate desulfinase/cysteine desulfurase-like protein
MSHGIAGFGKACEIEHRLMKQDIKKIENLRKYLEEKF